VSSPRPTPGPQRTASSSRCERSWRTPYRSCGLVGQAQGDLLPSFALASSNSDHIAQLHETEQDAATLPHPDPSTPGPLVAKLAGGGLRNNCSTAERERGLSVGGLSLGGVCGGCSERIEAIGGGHGAKGGRPERRGCWEEWIRPVWPIYHGVASVKQRRDSR